MAPRKKKVSSSQNNTNNEASSSTRVTVIIAIIGLVGTLGAAYISYLSTRSQVEIPIIATQTAEARMVATFSSSSTFSQMPSVTDLNKPIQKYGEIVHHLDGGFQTVSAGESRANFMASVDFIVPFPNHSWNNAISFRDGVRVWVNSNSDGSGEGGYGYYDNERKWKDEVFKLPNGLLNTQMGDKNNIQVIAYENLGCLYVNNQSIAAISLPNPITAGDIVIGISEPENKVESAITKYENFSIYTLDSGITSCPDQK